MLDVVAPAKDLLRFLVGFGTTTGCCIAELDVIVDTRRASRAFFSSSNSYHPHNTTAVLAIPPKIHGSLLVILPFQVSVTRQHPCSFE